MSDFHGKRAFEAKIREVTLFLKNDDSLEKILSITPTEVGYIRHGRWTITNDGAARCSACDRKMNPFAYGYPHCPMCGAKMDGR